MDEDVKKIYEYVSKMEEKHSNKLTGGKNIFADTINSAVMSAYGMTRWFIEDMLNSNSKKGVIHIGKDTE